MAIAPPNNSPNYPSTTNKKPDPAGFRVVETIRDPDGVIATITERVTDGRVSFSIAREITKQGKTDRTAYLGRRHLAALRRLVDDLEEKLELAEDRARTKRR